MSNRLWTALERARLLLVAEGWAFFEWRSASRAANATIPSLTALAAEEKENSRLLAGEIDEPQEAFL